MVGPQTKKMTLNRNYTLVTRFGHTIRFEKDVPQDVPLILVAEAMQIGALPSDGEVPLEPEAQKRYIPQSQPERDEAIRKAMTEIVSKNVTTEFTTAGIPHSKAIGALVGFEVTARERDRNWQAMQEEKLLAEIEAEQASKRARAAA